MKILCRLSVLPSKEIVLHQLGFNAGMITLTVIASWLMYRAVTHTGPAHTLLLQIIATLLSAFIYFLGNSISVSLIIALTRHTSLCRIWLDHFLFSVPSFLIAGLLSVAAVATLRNSNFSPAAALFSSIAILYYYSVRMAEKSQQ